MGKSSLLRWAGRSPSELALALADALGKRGEVAQALEEESVAPGAKAAARAPPLLAPAALLVDEADALAEDGLHGFNDRFFDVLQTVGEDGGLQWIWASEGDVFAALRAGGTLTPALRWMRRRLSTCAAGLDTPGEAFRAWIEPLFAA